MDILENLDKNNLHHAYLLEGAEEEITPEILKFIKSLGIKTLGNPDFCHMSFDSFKIEDARNLKSIEYEKGFGKGKKIFLISANNFLLEAQNTLLKIFEEPIENTHFFIIVPDKNALLKTLVSRFYLIKTKAGLQNEMKEAEKFIAMPIRNRIDFIKELLAEAEAPTLEEVGVPTASVGKDIISNSSRSKALKFLNALETKLQNKFEKNFSGLTLPGVPGGAHTVQNSFQTCFAHIFKVREFLNQPGSSAKSLMESVALIVPNLK
jgi:DNA polymerase III delta prime subunit